MKLLFLLDGVYAPSGPTLRFGRALARQMAALGHRVTLLENLPAPAAEYLDDDGVRHLPFCDGRERALYRQVARWRAAGHGAVGMALRALARPGLLLTAFRLLATKRSPLESAFRRRMEALCAAEDFDAAISVSAPHYTAFALAGAAFGGVKAAYMADPYASAATLRHVSSRRREKALYDALDLAFITELMAERGLYPTGGRAKTLALPFPNVQPPRRRPAADDIKLGRDYVNCVFVGNLYLDIRSPAGAVALFAQLPARYRLVLVGEGYAQFPAEARRRWEAALGPRLLVHPPLSPEAAANLMQDADVLVSIGNSDESQLPSKVYDYVCTGLPVLNLCQLEDCPARRALGAYPLALSLRVAGEGPVPEDEAARAAAFLEENTGRRLPYSQVEPLYRGHTPAAVAEKMLEAIGEAVRR